MKAVVLINGVSLPHHVIDAAITWAVANGAWLQAIFVYHSNSKHPFHGWPGNKVITRFMSGELFAEGNLIDLIDRHVKYTISCCALSAVVCEVDVLKNPLLSDIDRKIAVAEKIFADQDTFVRPKDFAYTAITSSELNIHYKEKLNWCRRNYFSDAKNKRTAKIA